MDKVDMVYTKDAPAEFQPYMREYEAVFEARALRNGKKSMALAAAFGGAFLFGVSLLLPDMAQPLPAIALIAAILGGCWLHFNRQTELQSLRRQLDIEYFFKAKGLTILWIPAFGTAFFPSP